MDSSIENFMDANNWPIQPCLTTDFTNASEENVIKGIFLQKKEFKNIYDSVLFPTLPNENSFELYNSKRGTKTRKLKHCPHTNTSGTVSKFLSKSWLCETH